MGPAVNMNGLVLKLADSDGAVNPNRKVAARGIKGLTFLGERLQPNPTLCIQSWHHGPFRGTS